MLNTILWDHDGVLVDTEALYFRATREVLARVGVDFTADQYRQFLLIESRGGWHLAEERGVGAAAVEQLRRDRNARYLEMVADGDVVVPGALALLQRLRPHYRMAVVTSSRPEHFNAIHRQTGLRDLVEFVLTREDYAESKPHPEPYLHAVAKMGVAKQDCVVVEDSPRGLMAAQVAGLRCWIIRSEMTAGLAFDGADRQFASLLDIEAALAAERG
jgi:HAD superfamily hydrolase (TIGR01509 family)